MPAQPSAPRGKRAATKAKPAVSGESRVKLSLSLKGGAAFGPGKAALLETVAARGSISAAARDLGMSYRKAWNMIDNLNRAFRGPLIDTAFGGAGGGGAALTAAGRDVLAAYRAMEKALVKAVAADLRRMERHAAPAETRAPSGAGRSTARE